MNRYSFHFAWSPWSDTTQRLLELRRNAFFPDDFGRARRHSWNKTYRRWKPKSAFLIWTAEKFKGAHLSAGWEY